MSVTRAVFKPIYRSKNRLYQIGQMILCFITSSREKLDTLKSIKMDQNYAYNWM